MKNHYATLGVKPDASAEAIRIAYRREMRLHHPDRGAIDGGARAAELNVAYRCLSDEERRHEYDRAQGFSTAPQFTFRPVKSPPRQNGYSEREKEAAAMARNSDRPRFASFPLSWLVVLTVLLAVPFFYGIWINGY